MSSLNNKLLKIFVFKNGQPLGWDCFEQETVSIGSGDNIDLDIGLEDISKHYATLKVIGKAIYFYDVDAPLGVELNGVKLKKGKVKPLDTMKIGNYEFKVKFVNQASTAPISKTDYSPFIQESVEQKSAAKEFEVDEPTDVDILLNTKSNAQNTESEPSTIIEPSINTDSLEVTRVVSFKEVSELNKDSIKTDKFVISKQEFEEDEYTEEEEREYIDFKENNEEIKNIKEENINDKDEIEDEEYYYFDKDYEEDYEEDDEEDDEEEDEEYFFSYSLSESIVNENPIIQDIENELNNELAVEVIKYNDEIIYSFRELGDKQQYAASMDKNFKVINLGKGKCKIVFSKNINGYICNNNINISLDNLKSFENSYKDITSSKNINNDSLFEYTIGIESYVDLTINNISYRIRFAKKPVINYSKNRIKIDKSHLTFLSSSVLFNFVVLFVIGLFAKEANFDTENQYMMFAKVDIRDIHLEEPKKEIEPPKIIQKKIEVPQKKLKVKKYRRKRRKYSGNTIPTKKESTRKLFSALSKLDSKKTASLDLSHGFTNIEADHMASSSSKGFKLSGVQVKAPTDDLYTAPSGGVGTKGGTDLLKNGSSKVAGTKLVGGNTKNHKVKGTVSKITSRKIKLSKNGILSRKEIADVINNNIHKISYCYEKRLIHDSSLRGKLVFEWSIAKTGYVSSVSTKFSSMKSIQVVNCVKNTIKGFKFPKPRGQGAVIVSYPFIFESTGF